jgi:DNA ligase-1
MKGAVAPTDLSSLRYPLLASEKIDGWRCLVADIEWARANIPCEPKHREYFEAAQHCIALSASLKPISNLYVQRMLDHPELHGLDGELIASDKFNETSSAFASYAGEPSFAFQIFDLFDRPNDPFESRLQALHCRALPGLSDNVELLRLPQIEIQEADALGRVLERVLESGGEGVVTRDPRGAYKFGRATEKQQWMLKMKPFVDAEAVVVGVEELMHNENEAETSQLGLQKRSSHKDGKVASGKLGALRVVRMVDYDSWVEAGLHPYRSQEDIPSFRIGTGFDDATRHLLWAQREELFGRIVKFKSMLHGTLDAPRHPVFLGFRAEDYS